MITTKPHKPLTQISIDIPHTMELKERPELNGWQKLFDFPNGHKASVVFHDHSYGLELALLNKDGMIIQHPEITNDVEGFLSPDGAEYLLNKIAKL